MSYQVQDIISREVCHIREGYHIKGGVSYQDRDAISGEGCLIKHSFPMLKSCDQGRSDCFVSLISL